MRKRKRSGTIAVSELEKRMRPGAWSAAGFLGPTESLEAVIAQDAQTLMGLGVTHEEVADAVEVVLLSVLEQAKQTPLYERKGEGVLHSLLINLGSSTRLSREEYPGAGEGYAVGDLQVMMKQWRGFQKCPWGCEYNYIWGAIDFVALNRKTGEYLVGPGMIVHLVRAHCFFEGKGSPYRVEPARVVSVLEIGSG